MSIVRQISGHHKPCSQQNPWRVGYLDFQRTSLFIDASSGKTCLITRQMIQTKKSLPDLAGISEPFKNGSDTFG
jgi:hypothetical protein